MHKYCHMHSLIQCSGSLASDLYEHHSIWKTSTEWENVTNKRENKNNNNTDNNKPFHIPLCWERNVNFKMFWCRKEECIIRTVELGCWATCIDIVSRDNACIGINVTFNVGHIIHIFPCGWNCSSFIANTNLGTCFIFSFLLIWKLFMILTANKYNRKWYGHCFFFCWRATFCRQFEK